jgi:hypothetical protein
LVLADIDIKELKEEIYKGYFKIWLLPLKVKPLVSM